MGEPYRDALSRLFRMEKERLSIAYYLVNTSLVFLVNLLAMMMEIQVMKSKLHCVTVTQAELDYIGSITIDEDLMDAANLIENEQVHVLNKNNGQRLVTYVIKGERGSGVICLNGPAAKHVSIGDVLIVVSYASMPFETAKTFRPWVVFPDTKTNKLKPSFE